MRRGQIPPLLLLLPLALGCGGGASAHDVVDGSGGEDEVGGTGGAGPGGGGDGGGGGGSMGSGGTDGGGGVGSGGVGSGGVGSGGVGSGGVDGSGGSLPPPDDCVCDGSELPGVGCGPVCKVAFETIFHDAQFAAFYLTIPDDNDMGSGSSWGNVSSCSREEASQPMRPAHCDYQYAHFEAEYDPDPGDGVDETVRTPSLEVGVRRKGRASWRDMGNKPSLKVHFKRFGGERFMGMTRLTLNNMIQDPSMLRERMGYHLYRAAGLPAPLANHARVYVRSDENDEYTYYGVYANVQTLDRRFVEYHFDEVGGEVGNLYDTFNNVYSTELDRASCRDQAGTDPGAQEARFQLETNEMLDDRSDLTALIDSVYIAPCIFCTSGCWDNSGLLSAFGAEAAAEPFLTLLAMQALITDWDGFAGARNNFKLYHDLTSDHFFMFPWGIDQSFGYQDDYYYANWRYGLSHANSNRTRSLFMTRCWNDAATGGCREQHLSRVGAVVDVFDTVPAQSLIDTWLSQIETAGLEGLAAGNLPNPGGVADREAQFYGNVDYLRHYLTHRGQCIRDQLAGNACQSPGCPPGAGSDCRTGAN